MVSTIVTQGVVTQDPIFRNRQRMVNNHLIDNPSYTFSVYSGRVYFKVIVGLPNLLEFIMQHGTGDGSAVIVQGRLRVDTYTTNKGIRTTSLSIIAQRLRMDTSIELSVRDAGHGAVENVWSVVTTTELVTQLYGPADNKPSGTLGRLRECTLVAESGARAEDLLARLDSFVDRICSHDQVLTPEAIIGSLPDGITRSQAATLLSEITPEVQSEPSSRATSRASHLLDMED
ncbi:hypothetical protein BDA99DRAFT_543854 [Phascolomyces articulosus]|uniref:Uncharacterized protein n=1 Tax=Phascolomyces articulosus TaxID=60185 RepID=A0AAD5JW61_9FUNG|nr:hypothetical protein BDA99DRAFT_543854 [Phascolomyces articulosus]